MREDAPWSAVRNAAHAYGFAAFTIDPGSQPEGLTTMKVVYDDVVRPDGQLAAFETLTLQRSCRDRRPVAAGEARHHNLRSGASVAQSEPAAPGRSRPVCYGYCALNRSMRPMQFIVQEFGEELC